MNNGSANRAFVPDFARQSASDGEPHTTPLQQFDSVSLKKRPAEPPHKEPVQQSLCVLGSGDFGRALASRAVQCGFRVVIGTRNVSKDPKMKQLIEASGATLENQTDALRHSDVVVVAVSRSHYASLPLQELANKTLIDVSNSSIKQQKKSLLSNAEYLQQQIPEARVVKAFNVLSAYALQNGGLQGSKEVPLASDDVGSRQLVAQMVRQLGFTPVDLGPLHWARQIEQIPLEFFSQWRSAGAVSGAIFIVGYILNIVKFQLCSNLTKNQEWDWSVFKEILMTNFNRNLGVVALIVLAAVYLPGVIAGYVQLYRGTKYSRFPRWLDNWLKMRKQLGIIMLVMASLHGCMSLAVFHPHHQYDWLFNEPKMIHTDVVQEDQSVSNETIAIWFHHTNWRGELFITVGAVALCLLAILGISSLPSVTASLTWREFSFIQSKLGWAALIAASIHDGVIGGDFMLYNYSCYLPTGLQVALYLPVICVVGKIILLLPPIDKRLERIRGGYVRNIPVSAA